jgi:hypothetical protein
VASKTNEILTAIVQNMRKEEVNFDVKYAATKALENALEFANENFKKEVLSHPHICHITQMTAYLRDASS